MSVYRFLLKHTPVKGTGRPGRDLVEVMSTLFPGTPPERHLAVCNFGALLGLALFLLYSAFIILPSPLNHDRNGDGLGDALEDVEKTYVVEVVDGEAKFFFTGYTGEVSPARVVLLLGFPLLIIPSTAYTLLYYYPFHLYRKRRIEMVYDIPVAVGAMAISLQATPSLSEALELSSTVTGEELSRELKGLLRKASTGATESLEEEVRRLAERLGEESPEFKEALLKIVTASLEKGGESIRRETEMAVEEAQNGLRSSMKKYAASLKAPSLVLFSLGVMLPLMLVAILPLTGSGKEDLSKTVLFFNISLPMATTLYGALILSRRPPLSRPLPEEYKGSRRALMYTLIPILLIATALPVERYSLGVTSTSLSLQVIVAVSAVISLIGASRYLPGKAEAQRSLELEGELPEALYYIGCRMGEGYSFEGALQKATEHLKAPAVKRLFEETLSRLTRQKISLKDALVGEEGAVRDFHSPLTRSTMMVIAQAVERNPEATGRLLVEYSNFLKALRRIKEEMMEELSYTLGMMDSTATLFAPVILGVTTSMYGAFAKNIGGLGRFSPGGFSTLTSYTPIPEATFLLITGTYLIFLSTFLSYFTGYIRSREEGALKFRALSRGPLLSSLIFVISFTVSSLFF